MIIVQSLMEAGPSHIQIGESLEALKDLFPYLGEGFFFNLVTSP